MKVHCVTCHNVFTTNILRKKYCNKSCKNQFHRNNMAAKAPAETFKNSWSRWTDEQILIQSAISSKPMTIK